MSVLFGRTLPVLPPALLTKRKAYFAFHYDDIMRVNNVRHAWKIDHPDSAFMRNFYDSSLWESKKLEGPEAVKYLIRKGVEYTSAVCVLVGTDTWSRRWVKYEIARAVIDRRGLLAVHINGLTHHQRKTSDPLGLNPLYLLGLYHHSNGEYYLYEKQLVILNFFARQCEWQWKPYTDYRFPVKLPPYLSAPSVGYIMPLSSGPKEYDFAVSEGHRNIGKWIDDAAVSAGR